MGIFDRWQLTPEEFDEVVQANPSLRGMLFGYVSEYKLRKLWFSDQTRFRDVRKADDHDRTQKGDLWCTYRGTRISLEVKSLQTHAVKEMGGVYTGKFQCDASDRRKVRLPNGEALETTCLLVGEFDLLAVDLYEFGQEWRFAFARNQDLPRSTYRRYSLEQQKHLLATLVSITWPLHPPFQGEPFTLLDEIVREKQAGSTSSSLEGVTIEPAESLPPEPPVE